MVRINIEESGLNFLLLSLLYFYKCTQAKYMKPGTLRVSIYYLSTSTDARECLTENTDYLSLFTLTTHRARDSCLPPHVDTWASKQHSCTQLFKLKRKMQDLKMSLHTKNRPSNPMLPNEKATILDSPDFPFLGEGRQGQRVRERES